MATTTTRRFKAGQFCWVDLVAHDMEDAKSFYTDLFGWTVEQQDTEGGPPYAMFFKGEDVVAGVGEMSDEMREGGLPPAWNSYVNVDDVEEATRRAESVGAEIVTPPMQVMEAGWLAFIQDPTGAVLGLWQDGAHRGAERVNEPDTFCWNELNTRDLEGAQSFFGDLFGWTFEEYPMPTASYYEIKNRGRENGGMLEMNEEWGDLPPNWITYFAVADVDESIVRLRDLGGTLHHGPIDSDAGPIAVVFDPQGAAFNLIELRDNG